MSLSTKMPASWLALIGMPGSAGIPDVITSTKQASFEGRTLFITASSADLKVGPVG
jgi:hypothetical protein